MDNKKRIYTLKPLNDIKGEPLEYAKDIKKTFSWFLTKHRAEKAMEKATQTPRVFTRQDKFDLSKIKFPYIKDTEEDMPASDIEDEDFD